MPTEGLPTEVQTLDRQFAVRIMPDWVLASDGEMHQCESPHRSPHRGQWRVAQLIRSRRFLTTAYHLHFRALPGADPGYPTKVVACGEDGWAPCDRLSLCRDFWPSIKGSVYRHPR